MTEGMISKIITKSMTVLDHTDQRFFEGFLTVEMKDRQGEITVVDELYKCLPIWMDRGAPITDTHSNRVVGKGINFMKTTFESEGVTYPAIKITGKIHKNYELDESIWEKIKSGEYKGLSFGGATKTNRSPKVMKDGSIAYELKDLEHYEVAVCKDPAVPLALITDYNPIAKAVSDGEELPNGKMKIGCDKFGCYVKRPDLKKKDDPCWEGYEAIGMKDKDGKQVPNCVPKEDKKKGDDFSNADLISGTTSNDIDSGGMGKTSKPTKLDGGLPDLKAPKIKNDPYGNSAGTGVRGLGGFGAHNQKSPEDQTQQVSNVEEKTKFVKEILAGAGKVLNGDASTEPEIADKSAYETNQHNIKLREESIPKKPNEEIV